MSARLFAGRCAVVAAVVACTSPLHAQPAANEEELEVEAASKPSQAPADDISALRAELARLKKRVEDLESKPSVAPAAQPPEGGGTSKPASPFGAPEVLKRTLGLEAFDISAYVQAQYEWHQDSEDELVQGGQPLNQDRFLIRRGRVRLDAAWSWSALSLEVDGNTTRGPSFGLRRAEASLLWRGPWGGPATDLSALRGGDGAPPLMMLTVGLMDIPFGFELGHAARDRVFTERSTGSVALFPGEPDVGARLSGGISFFRYSLAVMNGEPLDERAGRVTRDYNDDKDFVGRLGVHVNPIESLTISGGVSALRGTGFHAGNDGTKDDVQWKDINENGSIDPGELIAAPGSAPTPSENFDRWGLGLDLRIRIETPIGETHVYGEATIAQNLDRGLFVADPILTGIDVRELAAYGAVVQEITPYAFVGFRFDWYDPNGDFFDTRGGKVLPSSQVVRTLSPVVGGGFPGQWRLSVQYDNVDDSLARDAIGLPADLDNDRFTARLQVSL
ncbi:MAG: hypothetical protein HOW73_14665 [Polyangiaceae bacterium]|nr:hypothetical protein [Polyangiaceae bacterium]